MSMSITDCSLVYVASASPHPKHTVRCTVEVSASDLTVFRALPGLGDGVPARIWADVNAKIARLLAKGL